jgi:hypothetical protein
VRCPNNPQVGGVNLKSAINASLRDVSIGVDVAMINTAQPTNTAVVGLQLPQNNNSAAVAATNVKVSGFYTGITHSELAFLDHVGAYRCMVGIAPQSGYHLSNYISVVVSDCPTAIKGPGAVSPPAYIAGTVNFQYATSSWYSSVYALDDASNTVIGELDYHAVRQAVGRVQDFPANGGANLAARQVGGTRIARSQRASGNLLLGNGGAVWADVDNTLDLALSAHVGQYVEANINALVVAATNGLYFTVASLVSGTPTNFGYLTGWIAATDSTTGYAALGSPYVFQVTAAMLDTDKFLRLRLRYQTDSATPTRQTYATATFPLVFTAKVLP